MHFTLTAAAKDVARWRQDPVAILLWLGIPFLIGGLLTMLVGGGNLQPRGTLLIADQDQTFLSGAISGAFAQGTLGEIIVVESVNLVDGSRRIEAGEASALLIIPAGFSAAVLEQQAVSLVLRTNPAQRILPSIMQDVVEILLDAGFYAQQMFAEEIASAQAAGDRPDKLVVADIAVQVNEKIQTAGLRLFPPAFDIDIVAPPATEPQPPLALLFLPGIVLMAIVFAANGLAGDYWTERERGTLRRLLYAPRGLPGFLAGKALAVAVVMALLAGLTLVAGFIYHSVSFAKLAGMLGFSVLAGVALFAWFGFLQMLAGSRQAANLLTTFLLFPLLMIGGSFFPFAAMPDWLARLGRVTPNGFVADRLTNGLTGAAAPGIDLASWMLLLSLAVAGLALSAWRLRAGFARG